VQTTKLIVARHGNTFNKGDVILRIGSRTDLPLTEEGHAQGKRLGATILGMELYPTRFYSAPLRRTIETSLEIASCFDLGAPPMIAEFLTELDYGDDDGRPETEVVRRLGACEAQEMGLAPTPSDEELVELGKKALRRWETECVLPVGWRFLQRRVESLEDEWRAFGEEIAAKYPAETVVATTSNGIARFSLALLPERVERPKERKLSTGASAVYILDRERNKWTLTAWNVR
jgi:2,3-bisphosphoglycerate-dependent phosphoglycerate mutase